MPNTTRESWIDKLNEKEYWILEKTAQQTDIGCPSFTRVNRELIAFIEQVREEALKEGEEKGRKEMKEDMYDKLSEWHGTGIAMLDDYFKL